MKLKSLALSLLTLACILAAAPVFAADPVTTKVVALQNLKITKVTGVIEIKVTKADGTVETIKVEAGKPIPVIPGGKSFAVNVISGDATIGLGKYTVNANAGDQFGVAVNDVAKGQIVIQPTNATTNVEVTNPLGHVATVTQATPYTVTQKSYGVESAGLVDGSGGGLVFEATTVVNNPLQETTVASPSAP